MDQPDPIIHQPARLKIMAALRALPSREQLEFVRLKAIVGMTDGNLGAHIVTIEEAGYLEVEKDFVGKKPRTRVRLTKAGRRAFENYVAFLREIVGNESS
ncbi:MAG TPA: transcriptional regulator [Candidatus Acidoferrales bacterium]|jgi:DNA-binding MarR family transcriptional regulator|nr:transcriptional regulator [Candidatus Acidoferrales bacterium]